VRSSRGVGLTLSLMLLCAGSPATAAASAGVRSLQQPPQARHQQIAGAAQEEPRPERQRAVGGRRQGRGQVGLVLESISPPDAVPTSRITLAGYVRNETNQPIIGTSIRLSYSARPMASRAEIEQHAEGRGPALPGQTARPWLFRQAVAAGAQKPWRLQTTSRELGLTGFGVYPLSVEIYDGAGRALAAVRTFITFVPKDYKKRLKPTKVAWVWPLMDVPHRTVGTRFRDDRLATTEFTQGGRLSGLVAAAGTTKTPLTWSIDPALLDDARTMTKPYTVLEPGAVAAGSVDSVERPDSDAAARWLADLKAAAAGDTYFTTPYADPDVVALVRQRRSSDLKHAYSPAVQQVARDILGRPPEPIAWPPEGAAGQDSLGQLSRNLEQVNPNGGQTFLLSSNVLRGTAQTYTPSAAVQTVQGGNYVVAGDQTISSVIGADTRAPGAAVLAEQRFLAETAMITAEQPNLQRTLLVVPPRRWNPSQRFAERLLSGTAAARWLQPVTLRDVTAAATRERVFAGYPAEYQSHELSAGYVRSVRRIQTQALRFSRVFQPPLTGYQEGTLRAESSAWRGRRGAARGRAARAALANELENDMKKVHFVLNKQDRGPSLAGEIGQVPVTIANEMPGHSITVYLQVKSKYPAKLQIGGDAPTEVTIDPEKKVTVQIPMKATANGKTEVTLSLLSENGKPLGVVRVIRVNATGFGQTAILITGGALVVLFLAVGARMIRARRRNGRDEAENSHGHGTAGGGAAAGGSNVGATATTSRN
jgi:hypothetical protein